MPNFQTKFGSTVYADQWFPDRPVMGVIQPHGGSEWDFAPYITINHFFDGKTAIPVSSGDWIVIAENETFLVRDEAFRAMHRPVDDESAIALGWDDLGDYEGRKIIYLSTEEEQIE